jgi:uncharacterized membrane protein YeiH
MSPAWWPTGYSAVRWPARKRFDIVGFATLAIITGLGGGMMRDVLLNSGYPVALVDPRLPDRRPHRGRDRLRRPPRRRARPRRALALADVLALGCWSATGAIKAARPSGLGGAAQPSCWA